jgi:branched-subunit amino acid permease
VRLRGVRVRRICATSMACFAGRRRLAVLLATRELCVVLGLPSCMSCCGLEALLQRMAPVLILLYPPSVAIPYLLKRMPEIREVAGVLKRRLVERSCRSLCLA